ncbi:hypothetical protein [Brachybacterium sp. GCM10030252]|uniref:hypothetical protein n=1 Tax=Brachybacterium sp. GCM10030252 TaxID=3273380 RepID=UPI003615050A
MRRPPAPRLRQDRVPRPAPSDASAAAASTHAPADRLPDPVPTSPPATITPAESTVVRGAAPRRDLRRRAFLVAGTAAAAIGSSVTAGALLSRTAGGATSASAGAGAGNAPVTSPFTDVPDDAPGLEAMRWADETGVQPADDSGAYSPDAVLTRGAVALALHRFAGAPAVPRETAPALITDLGDDVEIATALLWLHGRGAVWGDPDLRVRPEEDATRDCVAGMLAALLRPALAGYGATWDPSAATSLPEAPEAPESASTLRDVAWLEAAGMVPASLAEDVWAGEKSVSRADLAISLHRANGVIAGALG